MSFEIKYDRDGNVIKTEAPVFQEVAPAASVEDVEIQAAPEEDVAEIDNDSGESAAEESEEVVRSDVAPSDAKHSAPNESWKALRGRAERAEAELRRFQEQQHQAPEEDLDIAIDEDALAEGKHLNKVQKKLKGMEKRIKQYEQQSHISQVRAALRDRFPDFDKVLTQANIDHLNDSEPEIAYSLNSTADPYAAGVSAYQVIKKLGIYAEAKPQSTNTQAIQKNVAKPRPVASLNTQRGDSPLSNANAFANGLTDDLRRSLYKEMQDAIKRG